jgi:YVTN family beta-propeller protein
MRTRAVLAVLLVASSGCAAKVRPAPVLPPLGGDGEVHVYALPLAREAERLSFTLDAVSLVRREGGEVPLEITTRELSGAGRQDQRPLAWGRVPPGDYMGVSFRASAATLERDGERARLLVETAAPAQLGFRVEAGTAQVVWATLDAGRSLRAAYAFAPVFGARLAPQTPPEVTIFCTSAAWDGVAAIDRGARLVSGMIPVGAGPRGVAIDPAARRAYVALSREDQLEVLDPAAGRSIGRIRLMPGDGPTELASAADGTLLVVNERSRTVSVIDTATLAEVGRVPVGDAPVALRVDRSGRRAYVANRGSASVTVIDVANRAVAGTIATDPEPVWLDVSRDGTELYVVHRGSTYLAAFTLPSLALRARAYVGPGAASVHVDPHTDLLYLSTRGEPRVAVYEPIALQPIDGFDVPGPVSRMKIDDAENTLLALVPERRSLIVVDLTSRKVVAEIPVGADPHSLAFAGERP